MLTDTAVRNAKPRDKFYKVSDSGGLYLLAKTTDKYWRMDYRYAWKRKTWAESTANNIKRYLEKDIFPWLGNRAIKDIAAPDLLAVLRKIESCGAHEKALRCREYAGRVLFRYAVATGPLNAILAAIYGVR